MLYTLYLTIWKYGNKYLVSGPNDYYIMQLSTMMLKGLEACDLVLVG